MSKIGDRVGAICGGKDGVVEFYGYGVYEGDFDFPVFGDDDLFPNPRIKLDNGGYVFGCQCWWGDESKIKEVMDGYEKNGCRIVIIDAPSKDKGQKS